MSKQCFKCGETRPLTEFYPHPQMADGHLNKCKFCCQQYSLDHRRERIEYYRAYDRARAMEPHRVSARQAYMQTDRGRRAHGRATKKYDDLSPKRKHAGQKVNNAIRDGKLTPWPVCALPECNRKPQAHHPDYDSPLDVVWLCHAHHKQAHALARNS